MTNNWEDRELVMRAALYRIARQRYREKESAAHDLMAAYDSARTEMFEAKRELDRARERLDDHLHGEAA
jgi:hypothetical protein